jgi:hypothetical protein
MPHRPVNGRRELLGIREDSLELLFDPQPLLIEVILPPAFFIRISTRPSASSNCL